MFPLSISQMMLTMIACLFLVGIISVGSGIFVLVSRVVGGEIKTLTRQISQIGQKGVGEDVAGLVGNASTLLDSLTDLVKTASGVGLFLIVVGFVLLAGASYLIIQVG